MSLLLSIKTKEKTLAECSVRMAMLSRSADLQSFMTASCTD